MDEVILRNVRDAHKEKCQNSTVKNMDKCKCMKNKAKKAVLKAIREKAEEALTMLESVQVESLDR